MGRDRKIGSGLSVLLLASITIGIVYWTAKYTEAEDARIYTFVGKIDELMEEAFGAERRKE